MGMNSLLVPESADSYASAGLTEKIEEKPASQYDQLQSALTDGWEIVQPVFARSHWSSKSGAALAYNFVLRRNTNVKLITVPDTGTIEGFISDQRLAVDYQ